MKASPTIAIGFKDLSEKTSIPASTLKNLYRKRKISGMRLGHRTVMFDAAKVMNELTRFEVKAVA